ncbi:helix-turn-helix domain-containing protein [Streptomyces niveus]|uniref:helix-turn-helix domain-containing protein n=1 Tax=Streptomyces niveus TaxID=193462 RepID=UPI00341E7D05
MPVRSAALPEWVIDRRRALGQRIAAARREAGVSQEALAHHIGVERRSIQRYEAGVRDPGYSDLLLIAHVLGVPLTDLVGTE